MLSKLCTSDTRERLSDPGVALRYLNVGLPSRRGDEVGVLTEISSEDGFQGEGLREVKRLKLGKKKRILLSIRDREIRNYAKGEGLFC